MRGKSHGIDYVVVFNKNDYGNALRHFPSFNDIIQQYRFYSVNWPKIYGNPLPIRYKNIIKLAILSAKIAKNENVDLIVSPSETYSKFLLAYLTGMFSSKPWTAIFQLPMTAIYRLNFMLRHPYSSFEHLYMLFSQLKISEKTMILTVSRTVQDELKMLNGRIKVHVIEPGCGVRIFNDKTENPIKKYDAVFFARLIPEKGFLDIPEIWHFVVKEKPEAKLLIFGIVEKQKYVEEFYKRIEKYKIQDNVLFLGQRPEKEISYLIMSSKLLIYPSLLDSFPLTVLETLACGLPVIAYDIPAISINYSACSAVKIVKAGDKLEMAKMILFILENDAYRQRLGGEAEAFAQKYNWDKVVEAEKEAYIKVLDYFNQ
jgi:glycosyltransferase involved in cell wall biosynthesis